MSNQSATSLILSPGDGLTTSINTPQLRKVFPSTYVSKGNDRIGLLSLDMYYSWFNLTQVFNNLTASYIWNDGVSYPIAYDPGFYLVFNLNQYLQNNVMYGFGHYLLDDKQLPVYFIKMEINPIYYSVSLTVTPLPTVLPPGWSNPNNVLLNGKPPQLVVSNNNWGNLIGFSAGAYPATQAVTATPTIINSTFSPVVSPITNINVLCSWVNDTRFTSKPSAIGSFVPNTTFGSLINYQPTILSLYDVIPKLYTGIEISFVDQEFRPLVINDLSQIQVNLTLVSTATN